MFHWLSSFYRQAVLLLTVAAKGKLISLQIYTLTDPITLHPFVYIDGKGHF